MVDDQVRGYVEVGRESRDVFPAAEARIDARVVARIEAGVRAVDRNEERQQMDAAEESA